MLSGPVPRRTVDGAGLHDVEAITLLTAMADDLTGGGLLLAQQTPSAT